MSVLSRKLIFISLLLLLALVGSVVAQDGLALLQVNHGARQTGFGSAVVSLSNDINTVAYNPATVITPDKFTASFGHTAYWDNVRLESGYFAFPFSSKVTWTGGIRFAAVDEIEVRQFPTLNPDENTDYHDISFKTGFSYRVSQKLTAGISAGWFLEKIHVWQGSSFNVDLGLHYQAKQNLAFGASVMNLGSDFNLTANDQVDSRDISLPVLYNVGVSYSYDKYLGAADLVVDSEEAHLHLGAEAVLHEMFSVRSGYMFNYDSKNFTAGASFTAYETTIDYAFMPFSNDLGTAHMFTLTRSF